MDSGSQDDPQIDLELTERYGKNLCENTLTKIKGKSVRCCSMIDFTTYLNKNSENIEEDLRIESLYDDIDSDDENQPRKKQKIFFDLNLDANSLTELANDS